MYRAILISMGKRSEFSAAGEAKGGFHRLGLRKLPGRLALLLTHSRRPKRLGNPSRPIAT